MNDPAKPTEAKPLGPLAEPPSASRAHLHTFLTPFSIEHTFDSSLSDEAIVVRHYPSELVPPWEMARIERAVTADLTRDTPHPDRAYVERKAAAAWKTIRAAGIPAEAVVLASALDRTLSRKVVGINIRPSPEGMLAEAYSIGALNAHEQAELLRFVSGQMSDGWGESFVQHPIYSYNETVRDAHGSEETVQVEVSVDLCWEETRPLGVKPAATHHPTLTEIALDWKV